MAEERKVSRTAKRIGELSVLLDIELPTDATTDGFGAINEALSQINDRIMTATRITTEEIGRAADLAKDRAKAKTVLGLKRDDLNANDEEVMAGKNSEARAGLANVRLAKDIAEFEMLDAKYAETKAIIQAGDSVMSALKSSKELSSHLLNVTQKEMELGMITRESMAD